MKAVWTRIRASRRLWLITGFWLLAFGLVCYGICGPRYDYYFPFKLAGLIWVSLGMIPFYRGGDSPFFGFPASFSFGLWIHFPLLFTWNWPLKGEADGLLTGYGLCLAALQLFWLGQWKKRSLTPSGLWWLLLPWLLLAGTCWSVTDIDFGPLGAPFIFQLFWILNGLIAASQGLSRKSRGLFLNGLIMGFTAFAVMLCSYLWILPDPVYLPILLFFLIVCARLFPLMAG